MKKKKFKFIDLFSGIGAFHQALESLGGECVFASDIDKYAIETYKIGIVNHQKALKAREISAPR